MALHLLPLSEGFYSLQHLLLRAAGILHDARGRRAHIQECLQYRLTCHELVAHLLRQFLCTHEYIITIIREIGLPALHARQVLDLLLREHFYLLGVHPEFLEDEVRHVLRLLHHTLEDVYRFYHLLAVHLGRIHGCLNSLLCFDCKFVECHILILLYYYPFFDRRTKGHIF